MPKVNTAAQIAWRTNAGTGKPERATTYCQNHPDRVASFIVGHQSFCYDCRIEARGAATRDRRH